MAHDEIKQKTTGVELAFARTSKRKSRMSPDDIAAKVPAYSTTYVQQYKFIRLESRANYEPLIMALKGLQISCNPANYLTTNQLNASKKLRNQYEQLKLWSFEPTEISRSAKGRFLDAIRQGLMNEAHQRPAHRLHYIDWALGAIDLQLRLFNKQAQKQSRD